MLYNVFIKISSQNTSKGCDASNICSDDQQFHQYKQNVPLTVNTYMSEHDNPFIHE